MPHGNQCPASAVQVKNRIHHFELLFHGYAGIVFVESVLLQESQTDDPGDFQNQLLVIGQDVASDQFDDLHQGAFLVEQCHHPVAVVHKFRGNLFLIPGGQVV